MKIDRQRYYTNDKFGNMVFNISRCYNDMIMANALQKAVIKDKNDLKYDCMLYIAKVQFGHLKEALKLLSVLNKSDTYNDYFFTNEIRSKCTNIINEIEKNSGSLNEKYLDIRNSAYHYNEVHLKEYNRANTILMDNGVNAANIEYKEEKYIREIGIDTLTLTQYFNCDGVPKEIIGLYNKVLEILQMILTEYINKYI